MNTTLANASKCYGLYDNNKIIGFIAVLHQPHAKNKKIKRVSRFVILPDYQGIGLGVKFLNEIAKYYIDKGFDFSIKTSAKNLILALKKNCNWNLISYGYSSISTNNAIEIRKLKKNSLRWNNKTASFFYKKR